jgi:hypothetical protein
LSLSALDKALARRSAAFARLAAINRQIVGIETGGSRRRRPWSEWDVAFIERYAGIVPLKTIARVLVRDNRDVLDRARVLGRSMRQSWTDHECGVIREKFRKVPAPEIGRELGRSKTDIYRKARLLGLCVPQRFREPDMIAFIREKNAAGWSDGEIARSRGIDRHAVAHVRRELRLPCNARSEHVRAKVAQKTREQLAAAGLPSIGHLRVEAFKKFARDSGWPEDLQNREVQILNLMWDRGPMTRREISDGIGMPWKGIRNSLMGNRKGGSLLATLVRRGLVVNLGRVAKHPDCGKGNRAGQGRSVCIYSLSPTIQRRQVNNECQPTRLVRAGVTPAGGAGATEPQPVGGGETASMARDDADRDVGRDQARRPVGHLTQAG